VAAGSRSNGSATAPPPPVLPYDIGQGVLEFRLDLLVAEVSTNLMLTQRRRRSGEAEKCLQRWRREEMATHAESSGDGNAEPDKAIGLPVVCTDNKDDLTYQWRE
jgi:hypothetical protein